MSSSPLLTKLISINLYQPGLAPARFHPRAIPGNSRIKNGTNPATKPDYS